MVAKYRTRFPMARIKKIMQADEEIGKVAQGTPVVVSKALELFLQSLLLKAVQQMAGGATKLSCGTIKRTVHNTEEFDFLREITRDCRDDEPDPDPSRSNNSPKKSKRARAVPPADSGSSSDSPYETDDASADADFEAKGTRAKMRLNMIMNSSDAE